MLGQLQPGKKYIVTIKNSELSNDAVKAELVKTGFTKVKITREENRKATCTWSGSTDETQLPEVIKSIALL